MLMCLASNIPPQCMLETFQNDCFVLTTNDMNVYQDGNMFQRCDEMTYGTLFHFSALTPDLWIAFERIGSN